MWSSSIISKPTETIAWWNFKFHYLDDFSSIYGMFLTTHIVLISFVFEASSCYVGLDLVLHLEMLVLDKFGTIVNLNELQC